MQTARFNPDGGPILVEISPMNALTGSYILKLLSLTGNGYVQKWEGDFFNTDDDRFALPTPVSSNDGRLVLCLITFTLLPPNKSYGARLTVIQDGRLLQSEEQEGETNQLTAVVQLFIKLEVES